MRISPEEGLVYVTMLSCVCPYQFFITHFELRWQSALAGFVMCRMSQCLIGNLIVASRKRNLEVRCCRGEFDVNQSGVEAIILPGRKVLNNWKLRECFCLSVTFWWKLSAVTPFTIYSFFIIWLFYYGFSLKTTSSVVCTFFSFLIFDKKWS